MLDSVEQQIVTSMTTLLGRAGLEYRGRFVEVNDQRVHYLEYGDGPPVILLHGGGAGSAIWFRQIEMLAKSSRVIVPDHPLFGLSSQTAYEAPFLDSAKAYMIGFMDALGLTRADFVALSLGAQIALAMAMSESSRVGRLVVIGSSGLGKEFPLIYKLSNVPVLGRLIVRPNRWGQDNYFKTMEVVDSEFDDAGAYKQYAYDVTLTRGHARGMRSSISVLTDFGGQKSIFSDDQLRSIRQPVLAVWGEHDPVFPVRHGYRLARLVRNSSLHVIDNARHVPLLDNPDVVNELIAGFIGDE
jgi:4,5:9,10-diseco-3-hydroxy-5,9,17-trioxoandrosta-1(10),2-diene-4-oate hydrolase